MTPQQEKTLLEKIKSDPKYFAIIFDYFYKPIFGYIYRRVTEYDVARDIAAETFLKGFLKIGSFQWKGISISAWLYKIATNEVNYYFRKRRYRPIRLGSILDLELLIDQNSAVDEKAMLEEEVKKQEDFMLISKKLKSLDTKYQEVIALRYFENKNIAEIALILGKPNGTIKSLLSRGLEKLRIEIFLT